MPAATAFDRRTLFSRAALRAAGAEFLGGSSATAAERRLELTVARRAMACEFSLTFPAGLRGAVEAGCAALDEVERLERKLSVYLEDSELSRLNREAAGAPVTADAEVYHLLRWAARLSAATGGTFDAAGGALVKAWGFSGGPHRIPSASDLHTALAASGSRHVLFDDPRRAIRFDCPGLEFNLGGIGKGFAIDRALHLIRTRRRIRCALMQGGQSSIKGIGSPPGEPRGWTVALCHPLHPDRPVARIRLRDRALGTSGAANRFFVAQGRRYGHVLDPRTGWPARGLLGASALAGSATEADALSTAFFVMGVEGTRRFCEEHPEFGAVLVVPGKIRNAAPEVLAMGAVDAEVMV